MFDNITQEQISCIAVGSDIEIGDLVETDPTTQSGPTVPRVRLAKNLNERDTGYMLGVALNNAAETDSDAHKEGVSNKVSVRLWYAGTVAVKVDLTAETTYAAGTGVYMTETAGNAGRLTVTETPTNAMPVGYLAKRQTRPTGGALTQICEVVLTRPLMPRDN